MARRSASHFLLFFSKKECTFVSNIIIRNQMKKIFLFAAACMAALSASAQYIPTTVGTQATYSTKSVEFEWDLTSTQSVTGATVGENDVLTVGLQVVSNVPGNEFSKTTFESTCTYNPANDVTTYTELDGDTFKKFIMDMLIEAAESQGQLVTADQKAELAKELNPRGSLFITIDPKAAEGSVQKDCTLSMNMGQGRMLMKWGKITFVGTEEVTVPAGTFTCLKYTYTLTEIMGEAPSKKFVTTWFAKGVGCVKEETADKKGNVTETKTLTSFTAAE